MRRGDEAGLVGRGREVDAGLEHGVEEAVEALAVALHHLREAARRRIAEVQAEHAADRLRREGDAVLPQAPQRADDLRRRHAGRVGLELGSALLVRHQLAERGVEEALAQPPGDGGEELG